MIVASIDIMKGSAVQLRQGKEFVLESDKHPMELVKEFNRFGEVAVIDLDAAMGKGSNIELLEQMCAVADVRVGGGIRDVETARRLIKAGARKLIFGTKAVPELLSQIPREYVMVALDHRGGKITDHGWQQETEETVGERAHRLADYCDSYLCTFVEREGGLGGVDLQAITGLAKSLPHRLTVAGGIATEDEIAAISKLGADVQVGMALYQKRIDPISSVVKSVNFDEKGLVPTIVQDEFGQVLMLAYSSAESLDRAMRTGKGVYFSRSRNEIWEKGLTSGNTQELISCRVDCDQDTLLFKVRQQSAACHTNTYSCFGMATGTQRFSVPVLFDVLKQRKEHAPAGSFSQKMFNDRNQLIRKILEEAAEVVTYESRENLRWEIADLVYFLSLLAVDEGIEWKEIESELAGRRKRDEH